MTIKAPIIIDQWERSKREAVRVQLVEYKQNILIEARVYHKQHDGEYRPTRKGLSLGLKHLRPLAKALADAEIKALELNLIRG